MEAREPFEIAEEWIQKWSAPYVPAIGPYVGESVLDWELPREQPELCLAAILDVLNRIDVSVPNQLLGLLAAGPLEDLLNYNGDVVVDEIETLARQSPAFRLLLNGVWDSDIQPTILTRLAKYRSTPW